jgi:hypothetical protein
MTMLPKEWTPPADMKRIIAHWTAGRHRATAWDKEHYHLLIEGDGAVVRGRYSIRDNWKLRGSGYAAHTLNANNASIGVAVCCMHGARERPFDAGPFPMLKLQWDVLVRTVAEMCDVYDVPVGPQTVLGHGEVQANLGIPQKQKWDPMVLPWAPDMQVRAVGDMFRGEVRRARRPSRRLEERPAFIRATVDHVDFTDVFIADASSYIGLSAVVAAFGWELLGEDEDAVALRIADREHRIAAVEFDHARFLNLRELATALDRSIAWDAEHRQVHVT